MHTSPELQAALTRRFRLTEGVVCSPAAAAPVHAHTVVVPPTVTSPSAASRVPNSGTRIEPIHHQSLTALPQPGWQQQLAQQAHAKAACQSWQQLPKATRCESPAMARGQCPHCKHLQEQIQHMESQVAEAQAHAERVEAQAAENLANYTNKVEAEWQSCAVLRERLEQLQNDIAYVETIYKRKVTRLEEQLATLQAQADNASFRWEPPSSVAETSIAAAEAEAAVLPMDSADRHPRPTPRARQRRPSSPLATPRMSLSRLPKVSGASASTRLSVERLRAHEEGLREWSPPSPVSPQREPCDQLRASSEPRQNYCETILAMTRNGEHTRPPWTARNSAATRNPELSRPFSSRHTLGKPRAVEKPKGTQLWR